jgi:hypothetical protein
MVAEAARGSQGGGRITMQDGGMYSFGRQNAEPAVRSPFDNKAPRTDTPTLAYTEGMAYTPVQAQYGNIVALDYDYTQGNKHFSYRLGMTEPEALRIAAGVVRDPSLRRDMAATVLGTIANGAGGAEGAHAFFARVEDSTMEVFDGISGRDVAASAEQTGRQLFAAADSYTHYSVR